MSKHVTKRYYGIVFGLYSILMFLGMRILNISGAYSILEYIVYAGIIVVIITAIILYSVLAFTEKSDLVSSDLEENL